MSLVEKLTLIAENTPKVYEAGVKSVLECVETAGNFIDYGDGNGEQISVGSGGAAVLHNSLNRPLKRLNIYASYISYNILEESLDEETGLSTVTCCLPPYKTVVIDFKSLSGDTQSITIPDEYKLLTLVDLDSGTYSDTIEVSDGVVKHIQRVEAVAEPGEPVTGDWDLPYNLTVPLDTPIETDITNTEVGQALLALHSYDGATLIKSDTNNAVEVSYIANALSKDLTTFWINYLQPDAYALVSDEQEYVACGFNASSYTFAGPGWNDRTYQPEQVLLNKGFKANSDCSHLFAYSNITDVKVPIDISYITNTNYMFLSSTIRTVKLKINTSTAWSTLTFSSCNISNLTLDGVIAKNGFDIHSCTTLSKESIISIVNALSSTTSGLSVTMSNSAKSRCFTDEEWATLIATKPNWTIVLK